MRSAILQLPARRTPGEQRQVIRAAIRQLDRAEIYLAAIAYMNLDDRFARREIDRLRGGVSDLRRHLAELRAETRN